VGWCQARGQMPGVAMVRRRLCGDGDDGGGVVRLHGCGQDETMLFEGRATARLTRQGGREPAVGGYLSRKVRSVRSCRHQPGVDRGNGGRKLR
jgi:hypothetical protein